MHVERTPLPHALPKHQMAFLDARLKPGSLGCFNTLATLVWLVPWPWRSATPEGAPAQVAAAVCAIGGAPLQRQTAV